MSSSEKLNRPFSQPVKPPMSPSTAKGGWAIVGQNAKLRWARMYDQRTFRQSRQQECYAANMGRTSLWRQREWWNNHTCKLKVKTVQKIIIQQFTVLIIFYSFSQVMPIKDIRTLNMSFPIPDYHEHYKKKPVSYVSNNTNLLKI